MASASVPGVHSCGNLHHLSVLGALGPSPSHRGGLQAPFLFGLRVAGMVDQEGSGMPVIQYRPPCGFKTFDTAARFCHVYKEIRAFLCSRLHRNQCLSLQQQTGYSSGAVDGIDGSGLIVVQLRLSVPSNLRNAKVDTIFKRAMRELIAAVAAGVFILALILLATAPSPAAPPVFFSLGPSTEQDLAPHWMVENLTRHKWQRLGNQQRGLAPEITTWEFYPDGTFRWRFTSDYTKTDVGAWTLSVASEDRGVLFVSSTTNEQGRSSQFHVLVVEFHNGRLRLGEALYEGVPFTARDIPPRIRTEDHEAVTSRQRHRFFSLWDAITGTAWQSEGAPPAGDPIMYTFMRDGTYTAHFAVTQCQYAGTWSLFSAVENRGTIRFSVPANWCDPRGPRAAFVREMPITLTDARLFLYQTVYVPIPQKEVK